MRPLHNIPQWVALYPVGPGNASLAGIGVNATTVGTPAGGTWRVRKISGVDANGTVVASKLAAKSNETVAAL